MWTVQAAQIQIALLCSSVFILTNSLGTLHGREKVLERQRRAALTKWSQPVRSPAAAAPNYPSPATSAAGRSYAQPAAVNVPQVQAPYIPQVSYPQQYSSYNTPATQSQLNAAAYASNPAMYQQYATQQKNSAYSNAGQNSAYNTAGQNSAYSTAGQNSAYNKGGQNSAYNTAGQNTAYNTAGRTPAYNNNPYATYNPAAMTANPTSTMYQVPQQQQLANAGYGNSAYGNLAAASPQAANYYGTGTNMQNAYNTGYNPQMQAQANLYNNANFNPNKYKNPYVNSAYPSVQSGFAKNQYAQPGSTEYERQNYALYQDPQRTPMQYGYNYNPATGTTGQQRPYNGNMGGYGQGRSGQSPPMVTPPPQQTAQQYELSEFCKKPDREPKCRKNSFGMCDYQENYPSDAATEFFAFHKSRITAMTTDSDYSNSDLYDTGFATQQNKLIDFVHDIFSDNEYGNLPGVPPEKKGLCIGLSDTIQPGWAKTSHGKYFVIMNSNNVKQTIRAEVCKNAGKGCQTVPKCYKSECRQRYRFDTLLVFDPCDAKRAPMLELFKIPDGCECFVIVEEPDLVLPEFPIQPTSTTPKQSSAVAAARADIPSNAIISQEKVTPHTTLPSASTTASPTSTPTVFQPKNTTETIPTTKQTLILSPR